MSPCSSYRASFVGLVLAAVVAGPTLQGPFRAASAERILKQVHVVARHGSKSFFDDSVHLTAFGKGQVRGLGLYLKDRYGDTVVLRDGAAHERKDVGIRASSSGSAILSAQILAQVLFNDGGTNATDVDMLPAVPVYSTDEVNDVYIRAYDRCPEGLDSEMDALADSSTWNDLRKKHAALLARLGDLPDFEGAADGSGRVKLENLYEVFDAIAVAKAECQNSTATSTPNGTNVCSEDQVGLVEALTDAEWEELYKLAQTIELGKYDSEMAGRLGGRNLWKEILELVVNVKNTNTTDGLFVWSGHYETILTMFSAVREEVPRSGVNGSAAIPSYASAIIIEGYIDTETNDKSIKVMYKDADAAHHKTVALVACDGDEFCSLDVLMGMFKDFELSDWCDECGNDEADVCMLLLLQQAETLNSTNDDRGSANSPTTANPECPTVSSSSGASAGAVVGTLFAGIAIGMIGMGWCCCRRRTNSKAHSSSVKSSFAYPAPEPNLTDMTDVSLDNANYT